MLRVYKQITLTTLILLLTSGLMILRAQVKPAKKSVIIPKNVSLLQGEFMLNSAQANLVFTPPHGFKEIRPLNNEDFTFDYAMQLPGRDFEVWYQVRSQKQNWASYERVKGDEKLKQANPDSSYIDRGRALSLALTEFTNERELFTKILPPAVLKRYNADAGRSYMLSLLDMPETKHYKYALLFSLQKFHTATVLMVCFTNTKGPEFYKNVERAGSSLKFKPQPAIVKQTQIVNKLAD